MSVSTSIKSIQDIMRKDTGVDGDAQRLTQLVWMFFLKIFDDKEQEFALLDASYKSPLPKRFQWRSWAGDDEGLTGDELNRFINVYVNDDDARDNIAIINTRLNSRARFAIRPKPLE